ncbi:MAG: transposase [Ignavibacteriales bacterium]|nr:transposase [Ignavibacteriales bacterium]
MKHTKHGSFYRRKLPHIHPDAAQYFITFRLANSLPKIVVERMRSEFKDLLSKNKSAGSEIKEKFGQQYFLKFDQVLDSSKSGALWLVKPDIGDCIYNAIQYYDRRSYELVCFTVMPNHVHLLCEHSYEFSGVRIIDILESIKKYSARRANALLKRTGKQFWQSESYDHLIRTEPELENTIRYILYNPVKAGLCKDWFDWKWTYIKNEFKEHFL